MAKGGGGGGGKARTRAAGGEFTDTGNPGVLSVIGTDYYSERSWVDSGAAWRDFAGAKTPTEVKNVHKQWTGRIDSAQTKLKDGPLDTLRQIRLEQLTADVAVPSGGTRLDRAVANLRRNQQVSTRGY